ncbi:MAG: membrane protein insertion efficiency factor YidD [Sphingorhabdus sp.]
MAETCMKTAIIGVIQLYQRFLSPLLGASCRFSPTCSAYAVEAIQIHGAVKGGLMSVWRILRCNPFGGHGYDPVPPAGTR